MTERILDLSEEPAVLHVRLAQLVIERDGQENVAIPLCDLAVLVVSHPDVTYSQSVLCGLTEAGGIFVACNGKRAPVGMLLPLDAHYVQTERFLEQAHASAPQQKRLWRQIVRAKVRAQGRLLQRLHGSDAGLCELARRVRSGDPENVEAQASRRYWPSLFADPHFRRDRDAEDQNRLLNYGYAVLRALTARAGCAAGLHPSLGLHHHNRYNAFCLADDLMEPFRPIVDEAVFLWYRDNGPDAPLDRWAKTVVLESLLGRFTFEEESRTLFDIIARIASSLASVYAGERKDMLLPEP
jgi:CRISP-associated protein Cas1